MDSADHLTHNAEKKRYDHHLNELENEGYRAHLMELVAPCIKHMKPWFECLDYGSGQNKWIETIFGEFNHLMVSYDYYFFPELELREYDLITCNEVVEHFRNPKQEFVKLNGLLRTEGILGIGTNTYDEKTDFLKWHYLTDPTHISIYHQKTIEYLCDLYNYQIIEQVGQRVFILKKNK